VIEADGRRKSIASARPDVEFQSDRVAKAKRMFDSSELRDELQALKGDVARLLNTTSDGIFDTTNNRAEALADQIKAALNDLSETLSEQEDHVEQVYRVVSVNRL
jgi:ElaB/YqjD/DUF883 family membrane-anchored ribosome-binding protein